MPRKQSSPKLSRLAARILRRGRPDWMPRGFWTNVRSLAGSVLSQDEAGIQLQTVADKTIPSEQTFFVGGTPVRYRRLARKGHWEQLVGRKWKRVDLPEVRGVKTKAKRRG